MKTAVEWMINEIKANDWWYLPDSIKKDIVQQAKKMNLEEIKQAYEAGKRDAYRQDDVPTSDEYMYQKYGL
jgi:hypothetical protein